MSVFANPRDLGEVMVVAHAVVAAETGESAIVLIDDGRPAASTSRQKTPCVTFINGYAALMTGYHRSRRPRS